MENNRLEEYVNETLLFNISVETLDLAYGSTLNMLETDEAMDKERFPCCMLVGCVL